MQPVYSTCVWIHPCYMLCSAACVNTVRYSARAAALVLALPPDMESSQALTASCRTDLWEGTKNNEMKRYMKNTTYKQHNKRMVKLGRGEEWCIFWMHHNEQHPLEWEIREDDGCKAFQQNYDIRITITKKWKNRTLFRSSMDDMKDTAVLICTHTKTLLQHRANPSSQTLLRTGLPVQETGWVFCVRSEGREPESERSSFSPSILESRGSTGCRICWIRRFLAVVCHDLKFHVENVITKRKVRDDAGWRSRPT